MSNSSQDSDDSIEAQQIQIFDTGFHILLACVSFYCYDCLVTIDKEIHNVWSRKWNLTTWIFAANRYGTLALMILQILPTPDYTTSCVVELYLGYVFTLLQFIVAA
ncbi:hypothetical protein BDY19DRAFT_456740 [Irpex rosettiformis]|uniref:Uncharacterized protein n=1 Tax=Irpex rosettiformis TaxID=378272 RepID=A0ACB8TTH2_9APHY|nr:hypothetical protein BDY19DRAFT_456740 [Irpex rosettiformis]